MPADAAPAYLDGTRIGWKLLAALACGLAAGSLRRGDYMRAFWIPLGVAYALLVVAEPAVVAQALGDAPAWTSLRAAALVASNALSVLASVVLARAYGAAGLGLGATWLGAAAYALAGCVSAAIVGPAFLRDVRGALAGAGAESWVSAFGGLADAATFVLLVPVLRFAVRIAGGRLAWPWWAFALSTGSWLLFDATELAGGAALASEAFRTAACLLAALAALYQRDLVTSAAEPTPAAALDAAP